jgi:hypothetical protein
MKVLLTCTFRVALRLPASPTREVQKVQEQQQERTTHYFIRSALKQVNNTFLKVEQLQQIPHLVLVHKRNTYSTLKTFRCNFKWASKQSPFITWASEDGPHRTDRSKAILMT